MKRPANAAIAAERFDGETGKLISYPVKAKRRKDEPVIRLSSYNTTENPAGEMPKSFIELKCTAEQFKDVLWLMAAIVIISIIHRYVPNSGAPPHSIVDVVRSANVFPK